MTTNVDAYNYHLPDERIALYPPKIRGKSRLLLVDSTTSTWQSKKYFQFYQAVQPNDLVILNNTKVVKARLRPLKDSGKQVELIVLEKHHLQNSFGFKHQALFAGKIKEGTVLHMDSHKLFVDKILGNGILQFTSDILIDELLDKYGQVPIPPYMHRDEEKIDSKRYQTSFASQPGSVAAPTASLNFTNSLQQKIHQKGADIDYLTLHVGLGTFLPIRTDNLLDHKMHSEFFQIPQALVQKIRTTKEQGGRVIAVGTTVARALEYASKNILEGPVRELTGEADIFIYPGYQFKIVDAMLTNFHAPKSTVLMLVAAFAGWDVLKPAYQYALNHDYNFLSYGDSMFVYHSRSLI